MDSRDITPKQAERVRRNVLPPLRYFSKLLERMNRLGFPPNDPWYVAALQARNALQSMHVVAHYSTVEHGVGRTPRSLALQIAERLEK